MERSAERLEILKSIEEYEKNGWFDRDVEPDPPTKPLDYNKVDYTCKKLSTRISTKLANVVARHHFDRLIKEKKLIIKQVVGLENYKSVNGGAILTCNHFNPYDNYAVYKSIQRELGSRDLYKVIREGNYTSFPGFYGYLFRHCNTLPLCSSVKGLSVFLKAVSELLSRGEKILIYPEQSMWWNYRKPRPIKDGAFSIAARNRVPVIPFFITMEDSDLIDESNGFPIQEYTVHILPPIYPDENKNHRENTSLMRDKNFELWKGVYERVYGAELKY